MKLDLHMHSNISKDGEFFPEQIVRFCLESKINFAALTDHDSTSGISEALFYAEKYGLEMISGVELNCTFNGLILHILGYGIDHDDPEYLKIEKAIEKQEQSTSVKCAELISQMGIIINIDELKEHAINGVITGEMIGENAIHNKINHSNPLIMPYLPGGDKSINPELNFYWDFCAPGKSAYVPVDYITLQDAIKLIRRTCGVPVLAHPFIYAKTDDVIKSIFNEGVAGIEAFSSYHTADINEFYCNIAKKHNVFITAGSDYHGKVKPSIKLGAPCNGREEEIYLNLMKALSR